MITDERLAELEEKLNENGSLLVSSQFELIKSLRKMKEGSISNSQAPLSRRDWFAGMALQRYNLNQNSLFGSSLNMIRACIEEADLMMAELDKEGK